MVGEELWDKVWGEKFPEKLKWTRGGAKFGVIGLSNGKSEGGVSCDVGGKIDLKSNGSGGGSREGGKLEGNWDYKDLTKIALKAQEGFALVLGNNPKESGLIDSGKKSPESVMFCIGSDKKGWWSRKKDIEGYSGKSINSRYYREGGGDKGELICGGNPYESTNRKITDGKKFN